MAKKQSKIKINLAEYDILFLVLAKLISAKPKLTLDKIKASLLEEKAQAQQFDDHQTTLKKAKWKHFLWSYEDRKSLPKDDVLLTVEGQLTCVAEALESLDHFIEQFGGDRLATDFSFVNKKPAKNLPVKKVAQKSAMTPTPSKKSAAKKSQTQTAVAKKSLAKKLPFKSTQAKKTAVKKSSKKTAPKKTAVKKTAKKK